MIVACSPHPQRILHLPFNDLSASFGDCENQHPFDLDKGEHNREFLLVNGLAVYGKAPMSKHCIELGLAVNTAMAENIQSIVQADLQLLEAFPGTGLKLVPVLFQTGTQKLLIEWPVVHS